MLIVMLELTAHFVSALMFKSEYIRILDKVHCFSSLKHCVINTDCPKGILYADDFVLAFEIMEGLLVKLKTLRNALENAKTEMFILYCNAGKFCLWKIICSTCKHQVMELLRNWEMITSLYTRSVRQWIQMRALMRRKYIWKANHWSR